MNQIALPSAARTANTNSTPLNSLGKPGCHVVLDVTAVTLTPSITLSVEAWDKASGKWYNLLTGAAVTTVSTTVYRIDSTLDAVANSVAKDIVPPVIRVSVAHADTDSITYSVGVAFA